MLWAPIDRAHPPIYRQTGHKGRSIGTNKHQPDEVGFSVGARAAGVGWEGLQGRPRSDRVDDEVDEGRRRDGGRP